MMGQPRGGRNLQYKATEQGSSFICWILDGTDLGIVAEFGLSVEAR